MSQVTVTYGFQTYKAKVTPSTLVQEVLIAACKHFKLDEKSYQLRYGKSNLDLSLPFRLLNLPFGAKIELFKSANPLSSTVSSVVIKLQLSPAIEDKEFVSPDPKLLIDTFQSDQKVYDLIKHFETKTSLQIFGRQVSKKNHATGKELISSFNPIVQTISKVLESEIDFQQKLSELGMSKGNHVLRIRFRKKDSVVDIPVLEVTNSDEMVIKELDQNAANEFETEQQEKELDSSSKMEIDEPVKGLEKIGYREYKGSETGPEANRVETQLVKEPVKEEEVVVEVFKPTDEPVHTYEPDESVYDLSVDQARLYQSLLTKQAHSGGMMTKRMRMEQELKNKKAKEQVTECQIRIKFPDQTFVQLKLKPTQTMGDLYNLLVEKVLLLSGKQKDLINSGNKEPLFKLLIPHPPEIMLGTSDDFKKELVAHCNLGSRSLLLYQDLEEDKFHTGRQYLIDEYFASAKSVKEAAEVKLDTSRGQLDSQGADEKITEEIESSSRFIGEGGSLGKPFLPLSSSNSASGSKSTEKKIPKWLKLNKK